MKNSIKTEVNIDITFLDYPYFMFCHKSLFKLLVKQ